MSVLASAAVSAILLPPAVFVMAALAGLAIVGRHRRLGSMIILVALGALMIASTPFAGERLLRSLEPQPLAAAAIRPPAASARTGPPARPVPAPPTNARTEATHSGPQAIVVLGAGLTRAAPEYGSDTVSRVGLERLRYAARLHRATGLPMLVSGGRPFESSQSEADTMRDSLTTDFRTPPRWIEGASRTTRENAGRARAALAPESIDRIYLVTHAWHMPRARRAFERAGFEVTAAPTGFTSLTASPQAWIPSATALRMTHVAMREWLGQAWYRLNFRPSQ